MIQDAAVTGSTGHLWNAAGPALPQVAAMIGVPARRTDAVSPPPARPRPVVAVWKDCAKARSIFARIVNVPCHSGMAAVSDEELSRLLRRLRPADESDGVAP